MLAIIGQAIYLPVFRLNNKEVIKVWGSSALGIKEKSVPNVDEDTITMAVEAGYRALVSSGIEPSEIGNLLVASVSNPYLIKSAAVFISNVLGIPADAIALDLGGSTSAGIEALSLASVLTKENGKASLVIASDFIIGRPGDLTESLYGAGAAAFIIGDSQKPIALIKGLYRVNDDYTNIWRNVEETFPQRYDDARFDKVRGYSKQLGSAIKTLIAKEGGEAKDYSFALGGSDPRTIDSIGKSLKVEVQGLGSITSQIGDLGCPGPLLALAEMIAKAPSGQRIIMGGCGSGAGPRVLSLEMVGSLNSSWSGFESFQKDKQEIDYSWYAKRIGILNFIEKPSPLSSIVGGPLWDRTKDQTINLMAGKCKKCGSLNFPRRRICVDCGGLEFDTMPLPRKGEIVTFNIQYVVGVTPEEAPLPMCVARMTGTESGRGGKVVAMITEASQDDVKIGAKVELIFRKGGEEAGLIRYGYKFKLLK